MVSELNLVELLGAVAGVVSLVVGAATAYLRLFVSSEVTKLKVHIRDWVGELLKKDYIHRLEFNPVTEKVNKLETRVQALEDSKRVQ